MTTRTILAGLLGVLLLVGAPAASPAAPRPDLWSRWERHDPAGTVHVDHAPWREFLAGYLARNHPDGITRVRYRAVAPADRRKLEDYVKALEGIGVSGLDRREQMAYWINFYNALTVKVILDHYPVKSIRDINISPGLFSFGPWDAKLVKVEGEPVSLNDMEHRILRPIWMDSRVHYAVNCASLGCPNLQPEPFTASNLSSLLDKAAAEYVNHPRGARVEGGRLTLSSIYDWFRVDFGDSEEGVVRHILQYAGEPLSRAIQGHRRGIAYEYDWSLNE